MADTILRELTVAELDAALADVDEQLLSARLGSAATAEIAAFEHLRRRILNEFRRRGL